MSPILIAVAAYIVINAVIALWFMCRARQEFAEQGRWSPATAVLSGLVMHGHFLATLALAWLDRFSLFHPAVWVVVSSGLVFAGGAWVIYLGRAAYGSRKRVYGLLEDALIQHGIYRRTRNPQYVGYALMFLGAAAGSGSQLALISAVLFVAIIHVFITRVEEPHMRRTFGEAFEQYAHKVGRYFGVGEKRSNTD